MSTLPEKILASLPKMQKAAQSEELAAAFEKHHLLNALTAKRGGSLGRHHANVDSNATVVVRFPGLDE
jgi:hypothetical protein